MVVAERYGVFLRPDPRTCLAVTTVTGQLRAQYGLVSAGAFPPHATLVGSLPLAVAVDELVAVLDETLTPVRSFTVENAGVQRLGDVLVYDVHHRDGAANADLLALEARVDRAVRPLLAPTAPDELAADLPDPAAWRAHLSLASHELFDAPGLIDELEEYVAGLAVPVPAAFRADTVALYRFVHPTWAGSWWEGMRWSHLRSWRLSSAAG